MKMKVMFFTDNNGDMVSLQAIKEKIKEKKAELAICSGDLTFFESDINKLLKKINSYGIPVLLMPGNHESEKYLEKSCKKYQNVFYINNGYYEKDDIFIVCIEGNGFTRKDDEFDVIARHLLKIIKTKRRENPKLKYVLVTHAPPYKTKLDKIEDMYVGNKSVRDFIIKTKPIYAISGHLHENERKRDKLGKTKLVNPGMYGLICNI